MTRGLTIALPVALVACSSGQLLPSSGAPEDETSVIVDDTATSTIDDGATDVAPEAAPCGVIACDDAKTFYAPIREAYDRLGGSAKMGDPHDDGGGVYVHAFGAGKVQDFDGGSLGPIVLALKDGATTAYGVRDAIRTTWLTRADKLGYPLEDEHAGRQRFENGCIAPDGSGALDVFVSCDDPPDLGPVIEAIGTKSATSTPGTDFGIAVSWLPTGKRWGRRADVARTSASSAKWIWAAAALAKNDVATVETPALPTFKDSNNSTAGQLIDLAGGPNAVNDFTSKTLGIPVDAISLCHWNYDKTRNATNCSDALAGDNFFTPNGALTFLEKVWKGDAASGSKRDKLLEWSTLSPRSGYGGWVGTQLPESARPLLHHKAGWLPTGCCSAGYPAHYNEIAIVPTPRGPYAVVLSMRGGTDSKMIKTLEWSSCVIYHALAKDADPMTACTSP